METSVPDSAPQKQCIHCLKSLPATLQYFGAYKRAKDGLRSICKACRNEKDVRRRQENLEARLAYERQYRESHREDLRRNNRKYEAKTRGRRNPYHREYRRAHPEYSRRYAHAYYWSHRPYHATFRKRYYLANKAYFQRHRRIWHRAHPLYATAKKAERRALKLASGGTFSQRDIEALYAYQEGHCAYCVAPLDKFHVEHMIPLSRGGSNDPANLVLACPACNQEKQKKLLIEWMAWRRTVGLHWLIS